MDNNYIILEFGKVYIIWENDERKFYKETKKGLENLTEEELKVVNKIFDSTKYTEYYSIKIENILRNNNDIENKDYIINFLNWLENIIPEDYRTNFYRNLETLKVKLNFDCDLNNIETNNEKSETCAGYNIVTNTLNINPSYLKRTWEIAQVTNNPTEFYWREVNETILHELCHMASSRYDADKKISLCGFNIYPTNKQSDSNRGLTEGMTEIIAMAGVPNTIEIASGYYFEASFVNQLIAIVGRDIMLESYFGNKGTKEIEKELDNYGNNFLNSSLLFRRIEDNFYLKDFEGKQGVLAGIQATLIEYYKNKMLFYIQNNLISKEEVEQSLTFYETMLITPEKLKLMNKDPNNYIGIYDSIEKFNIVKEEIISTLTDNSIKRPIK